MSLSALASEFSFVPVLVVGFLVQLFDNSLAIRPVAERVFVTAGLILGLTFRCHRIEDEGVIGRRVAIPG